MDKVKKKTRMTTLKTVNRKFLRMVKRYRTMKKILTTVIKQMI